MTWLWYILLTLLAIQIIGTGLCWQTLPKNHGRARNFAINLLAPWIFIACGVGICLYIILIGPAPGKYYLRSLS